MSPARSIALTVVLSLALAGLGAWGGATYAVHRLRQPTPLHELLHEKLNLTADQRRRIAGLERAYAARQAVLKAEMRAANADLARAIETQHAYSPQVQAAVDRFHHAMAELQEQTILHVFAMRAVLTPDQAKQFDQTVAKSLTEDGQ